MSNISSPVFRLPVVPAGEAAPYSPPAAGQGQTDGLPAAAARLQDGHPVRVLPEYVPARLKTQTHLSGEENYLDDVPVSVLEGQEKGSLPVVATVFDKLNQVYKEYLEAEQSYTTVSAARPPALETTLFLLTCSDPICRQWSPVRAEAARPRSGRSGRKRSSTSRTCTHTSCRRLQRGR